MCTADFPLHSEPPGIIKLAIPDIAVGCLPCQPSENESSVICIRSLHKAVHQVQKAAGSVRLLAQSTQVEIGSFRKTLCAYATCKQFTQPGANDTASDLSNLLHEDQEQAVLQATHTLAAVPADDKR